MEKPLREYKAIIWTDDPNKPAQRVTILAESSQDAERRLRVVHGHGAQMSIWNEDDARRTR